MKCAVASAVTLMGGWLCLSTPVLAQETAQPADLETVREELVAAKLAVQEAREVAEQIVLDARQQADRIASRAASPDSPEELLPVEIQRGKVAVEVAAGTVQEIATAIMPINWRIMVDVKDTALLQRRFQYVSTKSRDQALRDLLTPIGLKHQYFFDLRDEQGVSRPLLVISQR